MKGTPHVLQGEVIIRRAARAVKKFLEHGLRFEVDERALQLNR